MRTYGISSDLESSILNFLKEKKAFDSVKKLSENVLKLSDYFIQPDSKETPWKLEGASEAYACYFLPLGVARASAVVEEGQRLNFFEGLQSYLDFGSGPGTISFALESILKDGTCIESSDAAITVHKKLTQQNLKWLKKISEFKKPDHKTLLTMSYSLNELSDLPNWIYDFDALMILEPSTQKDFVKLASLRMQLIERGWHIWAPCTHKTTCPLSGGRDWCHDRVGFEKPQWWDGIEANLPIKNKTITFSYLLARKDKPLNLDKSTARLVGDQQVENGKTKQMVCKDSEREFVSWLHKEGPVPKTYRGEHIEIPEHTPKKGNELRIKK